MVFEIGGLDAKDDADAVGALLTELGVEVGQLRQLPRWNAEGRPGLRIPAQRRGQHGGQAHVAEALDAQLPLAAAHAMGVPLALAYLLLETEVAWSFSYHYQPLLDTLRGVRAHVQEHPEMLWQGEEGAVEALCLLIHVLETEILAENATHCGQYARAAAFAKQAVIMADRVIDLTEGLPETDPDMRQFLANRAGALRAYDEGTWRAAHAVAECFTRPVPSAPVGHARDALDKAIAALAGGEASASMPDETDRSVLRSHRLSLEVLRAAQEGDWVRVDQGRITYVYPFAVRGVSPQALVEAARDGATGWALCGRPPTRVHASLDLDDLWDGADSEGRRYDGVQVQLPDVVLQDDDGNEIGRVEAEIRFSNVGNHYLRFEGTLVDATPLDVHDAMFRATPETGSGRVGFDYPVAPRLADFATLLACEVGDNLGGSDAGIEVFARPGMFHVIVSVFQASLVGPGPLSEDRRPVYTFSDLCSGVGWQVLTNPIPHTIGGMVEWIRYPGRSEGVEGAVSVSGDHIARTVNSTGIIMLGSPEYSAENRASIAEFVASLDGLFAGWLGEISSHYQRSVELQREVHDLTGQGKPSLGELSELMRKLDQTRSVLHSFAVEARSTIATIESPSLVAAPMAGAIVTALLDSSSFATRVRDLNTKIDQVLDERVRLMISQIAAHLAEQQTDAQAREDRSRRARLDTMLAIIAAVGVSGLAQILQDGYDIKHLPALLVAVVILVFSVIVGTTVWWLTGRTRPQPPAARRRRSSSP